jgi:thiosulfate/3-mercaptopyruvate sulfurtransferase
MPTSIPSPIVAPEWLQANIGNPDVRILDCTVFLRPPAEGSDRRAYVQESGRVRYEKEHIPGALFADLIGELSDASARLPFTAPSAEQFSAAVSSLGIGNDTAVVCYDGNMNMWAARVWWLLRAFGHENAGVLDGGWRNWKAASLPVETTLPVAPAPAKFAARPVPARIAAKAEVLAAIEAGHGGACVVNALAAEQHNGTVSPYGRPGHIAGSVNVPAMAIIDPERHTYLSHDQLRRHFQEAGALDRGRVITYCGGGIAACSDALALTALGVEDVAIYDGSLSEWARDESLPMEVS